MQRKRSRLLAAAGLALAVGGAGIVAATNAQAAAGCPTS